MNHDTDTQPLPDPEAFIRDLFDREPTVPPAADLAQRAIGQSHRRRRTAMGAVTLGVMALVATSAVLAQTSVRHGASPATSTAPTPHVPVSIAPSIVTTPPNPAPSARVVSVGDRIPVPGIGVVIVVEADGFCLETARGLTAAERDAIPVGGCSSADDPNRGLGAANTTWGTTAAWGTHALHTGLAVDAVESLEVIQDGTAFPGVVLAPRGKDWRIFYAVTPWKPETIDNTHDPGDGGRLVVAYDAAGDALDGTLPYDLYTHCGVREAKIGDNFYVANPALDDGNGNPPKGWGNPYQAGTMSVLAGGAARFDAPGGLTATFRLRPNATDWLMICS